MGSFHLFVGLAERTIDVVFELVTSHAREVTHAGGLHLHEQDEIIEDDKPVDRQLIVVIADLWRDGRVGDQAELSTDVVLTHQPDVARERVGLLGVEDADGGVVQRGRREALKNEVRLGSDMATVGQCHKGTADERVELVVAQPDVGLLGLLGVGTDLLEVSKELLFKDLPHDVDREMGIDRVRTRCVGQRDEQIARAVAANSLQKVRVSRGHEDPQV